MGISNTQLKKEKLKELIWYIVKNYNYELYETKLWKLLFFCDSDYFEKYGKYLTGIEYIKNKQGPTPFFNIAKKVIEELIKDKNITKASDGTFVALNDYNLKYFDCQKIDAIKSTCERYYKLNTGEVCTLAHRDPIYLAAENLNDKLDFSFVAYRDNGDLEEQDEVIDALPKTVVFSKKAQEGLLKYIAI